MSHAESPFTRSFRDAHKQFSERDIEDADMTVLKAALLEVCTAKALTNTEKARPDVFNRHGTQHGDRRFFFSRALSAAFFCSSAG